MATDLSQQILRQVESLSRDEQLELLAELEKRLHLPGAVVPRRSLTELRGLGKEIWVDVDVREYLGQERNSWDG